MLSTDVVLVGAVALFGLAFLGVGLSIASIGAGRIRTARVLREAGPTALRDVPTASGLVEFEGTARTADEGTLEAPISGASCLAYTVRARSRVDGTGGGGTDSVGDPAAGTSANDGAADDEQWTVDGGAAASVPFAVEDGTDRVAVDPTNAVLSLDDWEASQQVWTDGADLERDELERLDAAGLPGVDGEADDDSSEFRHRQYRERRLDPGADVHVFGGSVVDSSRDERASGRPVTVAGDDWFEISAGGQQTVLSDNRRSGSMYLIFGGLIAVPGVGFTVAGIVGLVTTLVL
ncbi:hypothetical protein [Natronorubrum sp. FCH18a]|uniref:hypothetical protein n=1 Tax=Natronorubrum sp. FCH18a TaxID=3447018 RepID=UPI003F517D94